MYSKRCFREKFNSNESSNLDVFDKAINGLRNLDQATIGLSKFNEEAAKTARLFLSQGPQA